MRITKTQLMKNRIAELIAEVEDVNAEPQLPARIDLTVSKELGIRTGNPLVGKLHYEITDQLREAGRWGPLPRQNLKTRR